MHKTMSVFVVLAFLASATSATQAEESNKEGNIEWLLDMFPQASELPEDHLEAFGERSERADLSSMMRGTSHTGGDHYVGDVWIIGVTLCPADNVVAPGHGMFIPVDENFWLYPYDIQDVVASGHQFVLNWNLHLTGFHTSTHTIGVTNNWCSGAPGELGVYLPYINGDVAAV